MVTTVHDLNFKYFFGTPIFGRGQSAALDAETNRWVESASIIVSSDFMASEIERFYPDAERPTVIRLAAFSDPATHLRPTGGLRAEIRPPYLLSANNVTVHKNLGAVIAAQAILRERFPDLKLVMAGVGTEQATGRASMIGASSSAGDPDVMGLGYVDDAEINALIDGAEVVVNASLYEAGNGPGLDAWSRGTAVAMSDIPSFTEHLSALGVEATLFNPRDPVDIAIKLQALLDDPGSARLAAERSRVAIRKHTWDAVAARYLDVFDAAFARGTNG
jgi:glycosyltransferase involved in cell wall biosynthesis